MKRSISVIIIGAGPAGLSAAIQLSRYEIPFEIFEQSEIGGLLSNANFVENYPGFPSGIPGIELVRLVKRQIANANIKVRAETAGNIDYKKGVFNLTTDKGTYDSRFAILATGTIPVKLSINSVGDANSRLLYTVFPIHTVSAKAIAIVGAGDAAFDYALNLARKNSVTINNRKHTVNCLPLLWNRAEVVDNINYRVNHELNSIEYEKNSVNLRWKTPEGDLIEKCDYLIGAIGRKANYDCISKSVLGNRDVLERDHRLFMIGDLKNGICRQAVIAAGEGVKSAMLIHQKMKQAFE